MKPFYQLQRFLRRTQLLFLFLGVAYIMAGSVLFLQRHSGHFQVPSVPSPPKALEAPALRSGYSIEEHPDRNSRPQWLISRNLEIRQLRRRWFHNLVSEQDESRAEKVRAQRTARHKGVYMGCFRDDAGDRALKGPLFQHSSKMSSGLCQDTCSGGGYQFAGLEHGSECYCGNRISGGRAREDECNLYCRGEKDSVCGGVFRLSVFRVQLLQPGQTRYRNVHYLGCFLKPADMMAAALVLQPNLTTQSCAQRCTEQEFPLALVRAPDCFCGFSSRHFSLQQPQSEQQCVNRSSQPPVLQVYRTPILDSRCTEKRFLPEKSGPLVALSSFPGAGNTWLRHLIELATGFYTGSFYFDGTLYNRGFRGEKDYWKSGRTICVKTHESGQRDVEMFDSAILLIRNPYRALTAEFNRKCAGHLGYASERHWKSKDWPEFVDSYSSWWASHALDWLHYARKLLVVHYEELQESLVPTLRNITSFLNASVSEEQLLCAECNKDGHFKRSGKRRPDFDPFTSDMKRLIDGHINTVDQTLRAMNLSGVPQEYKPR